MIFRTTSRWILELEAIQSKIIKDVHAVLGKPTKTRLPHEHRIYNLCVIGCSYQHWQCNLRFSELLEFPNNFSI